MGTSSEKLIEDAEWYQEVFGQSWWAKEIHYSRQGVPLREFVGQNGLLLEGIYTDRTKVVSFNRGESNALIYQIAESYIMREADVRIKLMQGWEIEFDNMIVKMQTH